MQAFIELKKVTQFLNIDEKIDLSGDSSSKEFFKYKTVLAFLMKGSIDEFRDSSPADIERYINEGQPESNRESDMIYGVGEEESVRGGKAIFDVRFMTALPEDGMKALVDVETQNKSGDLRFLLNRSLFYSSVMVGSEKGKMFTHDKYQDMIPVFNIWVCGKSHKNLENRIIVREEKLTDKVTKESVSPSELDINEPESKLALTREVFIFLGDRERIIEKIKNKDCIEYQLMDALDVAFRGEGSLKDLNEIFDRNGFAMGKGLEGVADDMISAAKVAGMVRYEKGRDDERVKSKSEDVRSVMRSFNVSLDVAISSLIDEPTLAKDVREAIEKEEKENQEESDDVPLRYDLDLYEEYNYYDDGSSLEDETDVEAESDPVTDIKDDASAVSPLKDQTPSYGGVSGFQAFWKENNKGSEKGKSKDRDEGR